MAEAAGSNNMEGAYPRDLLQRFISAKNYFPGKVKEENEAAEGEGEEEGIELSLGLSLNGQFGVDPRANKLARSSSIPEFMNHPWTITNQESPRVTQEMMMMMPLMRTCSLPLETEEWKKRKALQSLRRMEAKRKRIEKQRNLRMMRCRDGSSVEDSNNGGAVENDGCVVVPTTVNCVSSDFGGERNNGLVGGEGGGGDGEGLLLPPLSSQGSGGSGSSGVSESESLAGRGYNKCNESGSPTNPLPNQRVAAESGAKIVRLSSIDGIGMENPFKQLMVSNKGAKEVVRNVMLDMPCVSTTGDGPNGKRIEGFLYQYKKGEEVRIVCVCHGNFLTPAEFVKHAGGGDVAHPLKHIVVSPSSFL